MKPLINVILNRPLVVLIIFLVGTAALGWQARHFEIDASAETLLTKDNKLYIQTQIMSERFSPQEFLLIGYEPKNEPVLSQQTFAKLKFLTRELKQLERVASVRSIINVPMLSLMDNPMSGGNPAEWTQEKKGFTAQQMKQALTDHPIYQDLIINKEQTATAIQVLFKPNDKLEDIQDQITQIQKEALDGELSDEEKQRIENLQQRAEPIEQALSRTRTQEIQAIRQILAAYEGDANVYLGGVHVLGYQLIQIIKNDLVVFGGIIAVAICLTLLFLFRRFRWVIIPAICCSCSVLLTVGLFGLLGLKTTVISSNFIALQLILTLAIVIHLIVQYREYSAAHSEWDQIRLVRETFLRKVRPCFYAGVTTSVGFGSLLFTGIQPIISFGWMMIIAMFFSIGVSLILFPALMMLMPRENAKPRHMLTTAVLKLCTHIAQGYPKTTLLICAFALVAGTGGLFLLTVENSFIDYFSDSTRVHRELTFIDQELGGSTPLDMVITIPEKQKKADLVASAQTVQQLQRVQKMLEQQKGVGHVLSIVNFTELAKQINQGKPLTEYELTAIYRTMGEDLRQDLIGSFFSEEYSQMRISARIQDSTEGLSRAQLLADIKRGMKEIGIEEENYTLTNLFVLYQDILQRLFRSQILSLGIVYLVLALTFCILFRSVKVGLIGMAPNILSTISVLGFMGWAGIPLDLMTITIASIAMGIAVDDTIHYIHRYREEIRQAPAPEALRLTNFSVGYAVIYTSVIIIMGFSLLMFSDFVPSVQFGLLASLAMVLALIWNISLLPVLLSRFVR